MKSEEEIQNCYIVTKKDCDGSIEILYACDSFETAQCLIPEHSLCEYETVIKPIISTVKNSNDDYKEILKILKGDK